jgi:hypothetical protein
MQSNLRWLKYNNNEVKIFRRYVINIEKLIICGILF